MPLAVPPPAAVASATLGEAALLWAGAGWLVFPLVPHGKTPYSAGMFCGRTDSHVCGFRCATGSVDALRAFWDEHPDANVGITSPEAFLVDEDRLGALHEAGLRLPSSPWQSTGREGGGRHFFLTAPADWAGLRPGARVTYKLPDVEVKGFDRGYVVAAPSVHATGRRYELHLGGYIPEAPLSLVNALTAVTFPIPEPHGHGTIVVGGYAIPDEISGGNRYGEMLRYVAHLYNRGMSESEMLGLVFTQLGPRFRPALGDSEIRERFERAVKDLPARLGEPRALPEAEAGDDSPLYEEDDVPFPDDPDPAVFGGALGEIVGELAPSNDASLVGILGSLIAFAGVLFPGEGFFGGREQSSAVYIGLVGDSGTGRKGTAMHSARLAWEDALDVVTINRTMLDGVASGEGLVTALHHRQTVYRSEPTTGLVFEEEYATLLAARQREGSTLDPRMRTAFDGARLSNVRASTHDTKIVDPPYWLGALIGISPDELRERLETGAIKSGSANRWLYLPVRKRDEIVTASERPRLSEGLKSRLLDHRRIAEHRRKLALTLDAARMLAEYVEHVAADGRGARADLSKRLGVIAYRIGLVHALVDGAQGVTIEHVSRAVALTEYARSGFAWTFGPTLGDKDADFLYLALREEGRLQSNAITRRLIRDPQRKQRAISILQRNGLARIEKTRTATRRREDLVPTGDWSRIRPYFRVIRTESRDETARVRDLSDKRERSDSADVLDELRSNPALVAFPSPSGSVECSDYRAHQLEHFWDGSRFVCRACMAAQGAAPQGA